MAKRWLPTDRFGKEHLESCLLEQLPSAYFDHDLGFKGGVATLRSDLIYQTAKSAKLWLRLTQCAEYPYYRIETEQLRELVSDRALPGWGRFHQAVCLGAADGKKEMTIGRREIRSGLGMNIVLLDSSHILLEHSLNEFSNLNKVSVRGELLDARNATALKKAIGPRYPLPSAPTLFTAFGNIVGNYDGLSLVANLHNAMIEGDVIVFGAHLKARASGTTPYPAYNSTPYFNHMLSVLCDAHVSPKSGRLRTVMRETENELVDVVEVFFDLNPGAALNITSGHDVEMREHTVQHIKIDTSCKFDLEFVFSELDQLKWGKREFWISECRRNVVFSCTR